MAEASKDNNRHRRWDVTFGNPALGTYSGSIVTLHKRIKSCILEDASCDSDESSCSSFSSCSSLDQAEKDVKYRTAVMTNVPPHQVPDGVLNLVRSHRPFIEHVRIVIGSSKSQERERRRLKRWETRQKQQQQERQNEPFRMRSQTWACENEDVDKLTAKLDEAVVLDDSRQTIVDVKPKIIRDGRSFSMDVIHDNAGDSTGSEEEKYEVFDDTAQEDEDKNYHLLFVLDSDASTQTFVSDLHNRPYTTLDETEICTVYHVVHVEGENGVNLLGPFFAPSATKDEMTAPPAQHAMDEHQCPVCLDKMSLPASSAESSSTKSANVASSSILTTVCNHSFHIDCLAKWQDSPCPVCRYDHSGLNETLSRCHVCSTTQRNYVCLICGVISCASGPSASLSRPMASSDQTTLQEQIPSERGHAWMHYEETLHAYALDTETQHVWDFAGGGYVHRLLQNEDGKIVESVDPRLVDAIREQELLSEATGDASSALSAMERSTIPSYSSSAEDDEAIHRKLEGFAGQYYTLLKSQLEQQRIYYEGRLEAIRREYDSGSSGSNPQSTSDLISALKQERNQLERRCATLRRKHKKVYDQAVFLKDMNESLEKDRVVFREQIAAAQAELLEARELTQQMLAPLEEKLHSLMLQLTGEDVGDDRKPPAK